MPTRQKRPSKIKQLSISVLLIGFLFYMGLSSVSGKYGTQSHKEILGQIVLLNKETIRLQSEVTSQKQRNALFDPKKLDPDILSQRARELLFMAQENDLIIVLPQHAVN